MWWTIGTIESGMLLYTAKKHERDRENGLAARKEK